MKTFIETYTVDPTLCDRIIAIFQRNRQHAQPGRLGEEQQIDRSRKNSLDLTIPIRDYGHFAPFFEILQDCATAYLNKYYYSTGATGMGKVGYSKHCNIQWYPRGGGYPAVHCERDHLKYADRALVWMLNLTDTPNGGTEFVHQDLVVACKKGNLHLWPSDMTHMHRGVVSKTHEKMIFTGWLIFIP